MSVKIVVYIQLFISEDEERVWTMTQSMNITNRWDEMKQRFSILFSFDNDSFSDQQRQYLQ